MENIRRYMNSIVHYYRVQQAQIEETLDTQAAEIENINEIKKETDTLATTVTTQ